MTISSITVVHGVASVPGPKGDPGPGYQATSATSLTLELGTQTFTIQAGLSYVPGVRVRISSAADVVDIWETGIVTDYTDTALEVEIDLIAAGDTNTHSDWLIGLSGERGEQGERGVPGQTGITGRTVWNGTYVPDADSPTTAITGDFYLKTNTMTMYGPKLANGTWTTSVGLTGATGVTGPGYGGTSTTSMTVAGSGTFNFTTQTGLAYQVGARVRMVNTPTPANYVEGGCTAYDSGTGATTVVATNSGGSGTFTAWTINLAGLKGDTGATGATGSGSGDMLRSLNLSDVLDTTTARSNLGLGALATKTVALYADINSTDIATTAQVQAATASKIPNVANLWSAVGLVALPAATGSVTPNFAAGINFSGVITGSITFQVPSNLKIGQSGIFAVQQDGVGGRTISYAAGYYFIGGTAPSVDTVANHWTILSYFVLASNIIIISGGKIV